MAGERASFPAGMGLGMLLGAAAVGLLHLVAAAPHVPATVLAIQPSTLRTNTRTVGLTVGRPGPVGPAMMPNDAAFVSAPATYATASGVPVPPVRSSQVQPASPSLPSWALAGVVAVTAAVAGWASAHRAAPKASQPWAMAALSGERIVVEEDSAAVGRALCLAVEAAANQAIRERGHFYLGIPGGSILKMLGGIKGKSSIDWSKVTMGYVNHRCVPLDDETSTHFKAQPLFLQSWQEQGLKVLTLTGSTDAAYEAEAYTKALAGLPQSNGYAYFVMMLVGMGTDGHVGSVYPGTPTVTAKEPDISVVKPASSSISMSLPVMLGAREVIIATAGTSEKYPFGKSEAMYRAV